MTRDLQQSIRDPYLVTDEENPNFSDEKNKKTETWNSPSSASASASASTCSRDINIDIASLKDQVAAAKNRRDRKHSKLPTETLFVSVCD
jgi:hypothetical protein